VKNYARYRVRLLELVGLIANRDKILLLRAKVKGGRSAVTASNLINSRGEGKHILSSSTEASDSSSWQNSTSHPPRGFYSVDSAAGPVSASYYRESYAAEDKRVCFCPGLGRAHRDPNVVLFVDAAY
jgi:hypothetical protein